jgi:hypothetical protein
MRVCAERRKIADKKKEEEEIEAKPSKLKRNKMGK